MTPSENYPKQYEDLLTLNNGKEIFLRPIMETDENLVNDFFAKLSSESIYLRFLSYIQSLPEDLLYRLTHINYTSEFALIGIIKEDGKDTIVAIARYGYFPDGHYTDFAVAVRDDWQHLGIATALLKKVFAIGRENGILSFESLIHSENQIMMQTLSKLGYEMKCSVRSGFLQVKIIV